MGNWTIIIHGVGPHHNEAIPEDANRIAAHIVQLLRLKGHGITGATFTCGSVDNLLAVKEDQPIYHDLTPSDYIMAGDEYLAPSGHWVKVEGGPAIGRMAGGTDTSRHRRMVTYLDAETRRALGVNSLI